jgi:CBS-domain-containing membrane protein
MELEISDQDIMEAMQELSGYLDITPGDFRELYHVALRHALQRIRRTTRARDVMTARVVTVRPETLLLEVAERMAQEGVAGVPVVDSEGRAVGVISERDFLSHMGAQPGTSFMGVVASCLKSEGCVALPIRSRTAADIMTSPPVTVREDAVVAEVAELMTSSQVNRVPVVDLRRVIVGLVSRGDLVRAHLL